MCVNADYISAWHFQHPLFSQQCKYWHAHAHKIAFVFVEPGLMWSCIDYYIETTLHVPELFLSSDPSFIHQWEVSTEPTVAPTVPPSVCLATSPHSAASVSTTPLSWCKQGHELYFRDPRYVLLFFPANHDDNFLLFKTDGEHIYVYQFLNLDSPVVCVAHLEVIKSGFNKLYL